jgi:hypothetical protein
VSRILESVMVLVLEMTVILMLMTVDLLHHYLPWYCLLMWPVWHELFLILSVGTYRANGRVMWPLICVYMDTKKRN